MAVAYPKGAQGQILTMTLAIGTQLPWFAVNTRARYEDFAARQIEGRGYEVFLPIYRVRRRWSDRIKELELPLFPGYLFCRLDINNRFPVLSAPGVIQIVGIGKKPIPVDPQEVQAIQIAVKNNRVSEPLPFRKVGTRVRVEAGPLCGLEGIIQNVKGQRRLVLSITLLQRSVAVEIEHDSVSSLPHRIAGSSVPGAPHTRNENRSNC